MLPDEAKTKEQLINELAGLRQQLAGLEASETERKRAEEALRESEEKHRAIFKQAAESIVLVDVETGALVESNDRAHENLGYTREEFQKLKIPDFEVIESAEEVVKHIEKVVKEGSDVFETQHRKKDGEIRDIQVSSEAIHIGGRNFVQSIWHDITDRKRAEEALRESEERYRALMNLGGSIGEAIVMLQDKDGVDAVQIFVSDEWPRITGYSRKELLGMSFFDLLHPRYRQASLERHRRKMGGEVMPELFEMSIIGKDGTEVPIEVTSAYTTYKGERANVAFIRDITERKQAEQALWESEERYKEFAESITDVFFAFDEELRYTYWNKASEELTGISAKDALGKHLYNLFPDEKMTRKAEKVYRKVLRTKQPQHFINEYHLDGKDFTFEISAYPTQNGLSVFVKDITERKQAEEREKQLQRELNLSSRLASIGELAAGVAHEINNPLTGILAFSERLLRKSIDEEVSRDLERIHSEAQRVARVVENLRVFARRREPKKEYSDINEILGRTLELRAYELKTSNVEVVADLPPDIPRAMVDFQQVQQVFLNIVLNAEQAMTEANNGGKLTIKTQPTKGYIRVSFADDGPGIPAENLDRVFDPFFTTREEKGGTGLGLSLCHGIVTEHGGRIYVKSKPGKGATFFVELPLVSERQTRLDEANIGLNHKRAVVPDWR